MHATLTRFVLFTRFSGCSLDSVLLAERASVLADHPHFFPTETCVT